MRARLLLGALVLAGITLSNPTAVTSVAYTQAQEFCKDWFIVGDVCEAVDYCLKTNDPACDQMGNEPGTAARHGGGY